MKYIITYSDWFEMVSASTVVPFIASRLLTAEGIEASDVDAILEAAKTSTQFIKTADGHTMTVNAER